MYRAGNIKVRKNDIANGKCYIYFSSNSLYIKDSESDFKRQIIDNDRYEWLNRSAESVPELEIFVRDIWLSWYVNGINKNIDSLDKLIAHLKKITEGYAVTTIGVSSGGYAAAITAAMLNASRCFDFSGQFSLSHHFSHITTNPFLKSYYAEHPNGCNLEAYKLIRQSQTPIYYFLPVKSTQDIEQATFALMCNNVKSIRFSSKRHGSPVLSISLPKLLSWDNDKLDVLSTESQIHEIGTIAFSIRVSGFFHTMWFLGQKAIRIAMEKIRQN